MVAFKAFFQKVTLDLLGFSASALCTIHCLVIPALVMSGAIGGNGLVHNHHIENSILVVSAFLGLTSLVPHFLHHRRPVPLQLFLIGFVLIAVSRFGVPLLAETLLTSSGALLVAGSHYLNWKNCRIPVSD